MEDFSQSFSLRKKMIDTIQVYSTLDLEGTNLLTQKEDIPETMWFI